MNNNSKQENKYIFFVNIEEQTRRVYEKSYKNDKYEIIKKENIMIAKKEFEKKMTEEILDFTLGLILRYNIEKPMIMDLSNELNNIIYEFKENWKKYVVTNHISILKLKKAIEENIAMQKKKC